MIRRSTAKILGLSPLFLYLVVFELSGCYRQDAAQSAANPTIGESMTHYSPSTSSPTGVTPLLAAVGARDESSVRKLLESGSKPDDPLAGRSPLIQAIENFDPTSSRQLSCSVAIVSTLLEHGADPNRADPQIGALPLHSAFGVGNLECASLILKAGGRIGERESGGRTVLMAAVGAAARSKKTTLIDEALALGAIVDEVDSQGMTSLHEAVRVNSPYVVEILLKRGANPCVRNHIGQTPLDMALNLDRDAVLQRLLRVTACANDSGTARVQ
jgi:ankyrin repeat protein